MPLTTPFRFAATNIQAAGAPVRARESRGSCAFAMPAVRTVDAHRRRALAALTAFAALAWTGAAPAQGLGDRTIRLVIGVGAGGGPDMAARTVAEGSQAELGQKVIVENRPGADGAIAARSVAGSPPDGATLLYALGSQMVVNPAIYANPGYDPQRDFVPVSLVARQPVLLVVNPSVPASSVREFVAYTKARPGAVNYSTSTSTFMLAGELFAQLTGASMQNIPFNGGSVAALTAVVSGTVEASMASGPTAIQAARDGRIRVLAVSGAARLDDLPDVPTFDEAGVSGFDIPVWSAILAPAGTPRAVVDRLNAAIVRALRSPAVAKRFRANVETVVASTPEELADTIQRDGARIRDLVARIGLAPR